MSNTSTKKKFSFWKLLLWIFAILFVLNAVTDGEFTDQLSSLFEDHGSYEPDNEQRPGYLGISITEKEGITGGYISEVKPGAPGADAGLLPGDIIVTIGNIPINSYDDVVAEISTFCASDSTVFTVLRNNQYVTLEIYFGVKPPEDPIEPQGTVPQQTVPAGTGPSGTMPPVTTPPAVDWLSSVPAELRSHVYLDSRGKGYCETLTGNVVVTVIFVSDPDAGWSDGEIENAKAQFQTIADRIIADAVNYGAQVNLSLQYKAVSTSVKIVDNETDDWAASALAAAGLPTLKDSNPTLETTYRVDAAPVIFIANHGGRAFASSNYQSEYAILYQDTHAFYHELNHIFGAKDFYYPADVKTLTETYLPNSIMVNSSQGVMDDFTAYLIGWTDTLTDNALAFLKETAYLTKEYLAAEHEKETYTGYVTDFTYGGGSYTGYLVRGVHHGQGKWIRDDGTVWEGTFNHGSFTGKGNIIYSNGNTYDGEWVDGRWHGTGTYKWANGGIYTGAYVNGERTGQGIMVYSDGDIYEGDWVDGNRHGKGTYKWIEGNSYTGDFVENERTGQGTWTGSTGNTYTGGFLNGNFHGQGTYKWATGGSYTGGYDNGMCSGQGTMVYSDGAVYVGQWSDGKRSGQGTIQYADGSSYVGQWADGKRSGQGTLSYANGNVYTGHWVNDTWNGEGTFTWTSGDKYTGTFVDGKRHGYGIYYFPSGNRYEGNWVNGERHGQGTMYYANGTSQSGNWDNGKFTG
ncbi:MAG: PDZ domain-containing protein [Oscillospiraceae bacterium]|nr:PDZ domain-containing protein [Oscillospiraceae bacterium]